MEKKNILLVCHAGSFVGIGHLSRLLALAQALRKINKSEVKFLIFGEQFQKQELELFDNTWLPISSNFEISLKSFINKWSPSLVVFDLYPKLLSPNINKLLTWIKLKEIGVVGIDSLINHCSFLDLI